MFAPQPPRTSEQPLQRRRTLPEVSQEHGHRARPPEDVNSGQRLDSSSELMEPPTAYFGRHQKRAPRTAITTVARGHKISSAMELDSNNPDPNSSARQAPGLGNTQKRRVDCIDGSENSSNSERKALTGKSSGGSGSGQSGLTRKSTAEDWFNAFNRDVKDHQTNPQYENDSPYYMPRKQPSSVFRNSRISDYASEINRQRMRAGNGGPLESTEESNSESFRSVIDDLTIKNQKLKRRLRKLEGLQGRNQGERLFEVRIHDLPEEKRLELERILQSFSASLDANSASGRSDGTSPGKDANSGQSVIPPDSGYSSVPRMGESPAAGTYQDPRPSDNRRSYSWPSQKRNPELAKMKTIVRKLEDLFTGGEAVVMDRTQLLQQQAISDMAAADEGAMEEGESVCDEGAREASMMSPVDEGGSVSQASALQCVGRFVEAPAQRPTRPLDLDPGRKQIPEENIEYLTHMTESGLEMFGGGWVYLNLIINLAQLHTINVTPPLVKKAIATASTKLELSPDGKMVRWKGGREGTQFSSSNGASSSGSRDGSSERRPAHSSAGSAAKNVSRPVVDPPIVNDKFHYKPLFARSPSFEDDASSAATTTDSDSPYGLKRSGSEGDSTTKRNAGPIIFYKGGNFCTDLSSAPPGTETTACRYQRVTNRPLGARPSRPHSPSTTRESPLYQALPGEQIEAEDDGSSDSDTAIHFSPEFTAISPASPPTLVEFEASGIGGVLPADNFAINCQTRYYLLPDSAGGLPMSRTKTAKNKNHLQKKILHRIPKPSIDAFYDEDEVTDESCTSSTSPRQRPSGTRVPRHYPRHPLRHEIVSVDTLKLPPSALPPASYYMLTSSSEESSSYGETEDDYAPRSSGSEEYFAQNGVAPGNHRISSGEGSDSDPVTYDPSPSSAATAGDASRASSIASDDSNDGNEENTFEASVSTDEGSTSAPEMGMTKAGFLQIAGRPEKPSLKRGRGSIYSSSSMGQLRKSAKTNE